LGGYAVSLATDYHVYCFISCNTPNCCHPLQISSLEVFISRLSPVLKSICSIQIEYEPLVSSASLARLLMLGTPIEGVCRLERTQKSLSSLSSVTRPLGVTFQALLHSILSLHPPFDSFCFSRFLTDETFEPERVIFEIELGITIPLPSRFMIFQ
jgi:hypothetical protein